MDKYYAPPQALIPITLTQLVPVFRGVSEGWLAEAPVPLPLVAVEVERPPQVVMVEQYVLLVVVRAYVG